MSRPEQPNPSHSDRGRPYLGDHFGVYDQTFGDAPTPFHSQFQNLQFSEGNTAHFDRMSQIEGDQTRLANLGYLPPGPQAWGTNSGTPNEFVDPRTYDPRYAAQQYANPFDFNTNQQQPFDQNAAAQMYAGDPRFSMPPGGQQGEMPTERPMEAPAHQEPESPHPSRPGRASHGRHHRSRHGHHGGRHHGGRRHGGSRHGRSAGNGEEANREEGNERAPNDSIASRLGDDFGSQPGGDDIRNQYGIPPGTNDMSIYPGRSGPMSPDMQMRPGMNLGDGMPGRGQGTDPINLAMDGDVMSQHRAKSTAFSPVHHGTEGGPKGSNGRYLYTVQDYLAGKAPFVSVAMDDRAGIKMGQLMRIPEMEKEYGVAIPFRRVDTGRDFHGRGTGRIDVCVGVGHQHESVVNGHLTLQFMAESDAARKYATELAPMHGNKYAWRQNIDPNYGVA